MQDVDSCSSNAPQTGQRIISHDAPPNRPGDLRRVLRLAGHGRADSRLRPRRRLRAVRRHVATIGSGRVAVRLPSRRASRVHLRTGMGLHARSADGVAGAAGPDVGCRWVDYGTGSGMAVVVRGTAMARIARCKATRTRTRIVAAHRIHDRVHSPAFGVCAGTRDCTKMSPPEDGSTRSLPWANVTTPVIVRLTGPVRS